MTHDAINEILAFWFEQIDGSKWFMEDPEFDRQLEQRFGDRLLLAKRGGMDDWPDTARGRRRSFARR